MRWFLLRSERKAAVALTPSYILRLTRAAFRQEAEELLTELDTSLLRLEATPSDRSLVDRVFRVMHTMKGSGATAGFHEVSAVLHDVEDIFNSAREGRLAITTAIIDCVLPITDLIKRMMGATDPELPELVAEGARLVEHSSCPPRKWMRMRIDAPKACRRSTSLLPTRAYGPSDSALMRGSFEQATTRSFS